MLSCYTKALLLSSPSLVRGSAISCTKTISWAYAISPLQQTLGLLKFKIMLKFPSKSPFSVMVFWANSNQQHRALAASSTNPPGLQEKWAAGSSPASGLCGSCAQAALSAAGLMQLARSWAKLNPYLPEGLSFLATSLPIAFNKLKKKKEWNKPKRVKTHQKAVSDRLSNVNEKIETNLNHRLTVPILALYQWMFHSPVPTLTLSWASSFKAVTRDEKMKAFLFAEPFYQFNCGSTWYTAEY